MTSGPGRDHATAAAGVRRSAASGLWTGRGTFYAMELLDGGRGRLCPAFARGPGIGRSDLIEIGHASAPCAVLCRTGLDGVRWCATPSPTGLHRIRAGSHAAE